MSHRTLLAGCRRDAWLRALLAFAFLAAFGPVRSGAAQSVAAQSGSAQGAEPPEITSHEAEPQFALHVRRSEVVVRVVVRDAHGAPVTNLQQADFRVLDDKKPQVISHFALEKQGSGSTQEVSTTAYTAGAPESGETVTTPKIVLPTRFMALYFDDIHLAFEDLTRTRDAADQYLTANMKPGDRTGVFTSSGQNELDFTGDRDQLHEALTKLRPRPLYAKNTLDCPQILPYQA
jgi:VWFA-related protein